MALPAGSGAGSARVGCATAVDSAVAGADAASEAARGTRARAGVASAAFAVVSSSLASAAGSDSVTGPNTADSAAGPATTTGSATADSALRSALADSALASAPADFALGSAPADSATAPVTAGSTAGPAAEDFAGGGSAGAVGWFWAAGFCSPGLPAGFCLGSWSSPLLANRLYGIDVARWLLNIADENRTVGCDVDGNGPGVTDVLTESICQRLTVNVAVNMSTQHVVEGARGTAYGKSA